jgi:hypothetical protein
MNSECGKSHQKRALLVGAVALGVIAAVALASWPKSNATQTATPLAVPASRIDSALSPDVAATASLVLKWLPAEADDSWSKPKRIVVNDLDPPQNVVSIVLVRDALIPNSRAPDDVSVQGLCNAVPPRFVLCSAEGVSALIRRDHDSGRTSAALFFLLAHELGHLARQSRHPFVPPDERMDLEWQRDAKLERIAALSCPQAPDASALFEETKADQRAQQAMKAALDAGSFDRTPQPSAMTRTSALAVELAHAADDYRRAHARWLTDADYSIDGLVEALGDPTSEPARWILCLLLSSQHGTVAVTAFVSETHPDPASRLYALVAELANADIRGSNGDSERAARWRLENLALAIEVRQHIAEELCDLVHREQSAPGTVCAPGQDMTLSAPEIRMVQCRATCHKTKSDCLERCGDQLAFDSTCARTCTASVPSCLEQCYVATH